MKNQTLKGLKERMNSRQLNTTTVLALTLCLNIITPSALLSQARAGIEIQAPIQPGVGLGVLTLGSSRTTIERLLGKPNSVYHLRNGVTENCWLMGKASYSPGVTILFQGGKVVQIETNLTSVKSPGNISVGSNFLKVLKRYKNLQATAYGWTDLDDGAGYVRYYYDDVKTGIAFTTGTQDDEATSEILLSVLPGNDVVKPESILIHLPGHPVIAATGTARVSKEKVSPTLQPQYLYTVIKAKGL